MRFFTSHQAVKERKYPSAAAARSLEIPVSTLKAWINGRESATKEKASGHLSNQIEDQLIENWLFDRDSRGAALTLPMLREMAILLLGDQKNTPSTTGSKWPSQLIKMKSKPLYSNISQILL